MNNELTLTGLEFSTEMFFRGDDDFGACINAQAEDGWAVYNIWKNPCDEQTTQDFDFLVTWVRSK